MALFQISLDALIQRDVEVQWFEGVALVQSVCRQLTAGAQFTGFPSPSQILLSEEGSVTIVGSAGTGSPVEGAARLLADLRSSDVPVQLRLLLTQASGADGSYPTLSDFSTGLAYFERSAPHAILQQLFARVAAADTRRDAPPVATGPAPVEKVQEKRKAKEPDASTTSTKNQKARQAVVAALVLALVASAAAFVFVGPGRARLGAAGTSVMKQLGLGTPGTVAPDASSEPVEAGTAMPKANGKPISTAPVSTSQASITAAATASAPAAGGGSGDTGSNGAAAPAADNPNAILLPADSTAAVTYVVSASPAHPSVLSELLLEQGVPEKHIYSTNDMNVVPPRHVYPTFPEPPADVEFRNRTVVDVVVSGNGLVERVHLRNHPRDIHEFMLLSAAKAWRFEPATLDGRPVRFLHSLTIVRQ